MRELFKKILLPWLKIIARGIIRKFRPKVIAVTGSFGKTSTKDAIYAAVISQLPYCRKSAGNLNNQWGLPLTIIGSKDPSGAAASTYFNAFLKGLSLLFFGRKYPKTLILEMGADKPGDIAYSLEIVKPDVSVVTGIGETHLELFGSVEQVMKEKARLVEGLGDEGVAVGNIDDPLVREILGKHEGRSLSFGLGGEADVQATQIRPELNDLPHEQTPPHSPPYQGGDKGGVLGGVGFNIDIAESSVGTAYLNNVVGRGHVYSALAALTVARAIGLDIVQALADLREYYEPSPGRARLLLGIKHAVLIDDTYNSSPRTAILALETLAELTVTGVKWAVLGDMLELGTETEKLHRKVGERLAELGIDNLITVGERANEIAHAALDSGMAQDRVFEYADVRQAGRFLQERMMLGDLILIKGSRGMKMEKIVKEVMAEPQKAEKLLVHVWPE